MDIYVYYRVPLANVSILQLMLLAMQQSLAAGHQIDCSLKRRPELVDGCQTWMEVYPDVPEHFDDALAKAVAVHDLLPLIAGERHTEIFVDIDTCA